MTIGSEDDQGSFSQGDHRWVSDLVQVTAKAVSRRNPLPEFHNGIVVVNNLSVRIGVVVQLANFQTVYANNITG